MNQDIPLAGLHWFFDHAETISRKSIDRIAALGGGIMVSTAPPGRYFRRAVGFHVRHGRRQPSRRCRAEALKISTGELRIFNTALPWPGWSLGARASGGSSAAWCPGSRNGPPGMDGERHLGLQ